MEDIHDIRPPVQVGFNPDILITAGWILGAVLIFLLVFYVMKKWLKNRKQPKDSSLIQPEIAPFDSAMMKIDRLKKKNRVDLRLFYFDLTAIFRDYMGKTFKFHAIEMTSQEFVKHINRLTLDINLKGEIARFQTRVDPIKYAGTIPGEKQMEMDIAVIQKLIEDIETFQGSERQKERDRVEQNKQVEKQRENHQITGEES